MRKKRFFTAAMLKRFEREGRGQGTHKGYIGSWHAVTKSDPASRGRSHWQRCNLVGRDLDLLSDSEQQAVLWLMQCPDLDDLLEGLPLARVTHQPFVSRYDLSQRQAEHAGTLELAQRLGIRHPVIVEAQCEAEWVLTTDLLGVQRCDPGRLHLMPVSCKRGLPSTRRAKQLAELERLYWQEEGWDLLMLVYERIPLQLAWNAKSLAPWTVSVPRCSPEQLDRTAALLADGAIALSRAFSHICGEFQVQQEDAQAAFWQAVWSGRIPIDLRRDLFRGRNLPRISKEEFTSLNPLLNGSCAWPL